LHDNNGDRDSHLWPGEGTIAWDETMGELKAAPQTPAGVLEIHYSLGETPESVASKAQAAFEKFEV
jgi:sugar phosphate isomerase/epimerase